MSDEEELKRAQAFYGVPGTGEVLADIQGDLSELGIRQDAL